MLGRIMYAAAMLSASVSLGAPLAAEIKIGGTGAAYGISGRLSEAYSAARPGEVVEIVPGLGSSGGIEAVTAGALQVAFSGRPLKAEEKAKGLQEMPLLDSPFVFVSSHPKPQRLTRADVLAIYSGTLTKWPDGKDISPILRPKGDSDTGFLVANFEGMEAALDKLRQRRDVPIAGTDQDNMEAAQKTPHSFAGSTLTQIVTESPRVKLIQFDGVDPTVERMEKGEYPLRKRLYLVAKAEPSPATQTFITFLRSPEADKVIRESGGVTVSTKAAGMP